MIWIEPGPLVAGTPPGQLPRLADQEMPGEQVILKGFYIDIYPYPNEEGAIPLTNVSRDGAIKLCAEQDKRLCGELEWERACKGPSNTTFEYGAQYHADRCGTGNEPTLKPSEADDRHSIAGKRSGCWLPSSGDCLDGQVAKTPAMLASARTRLERASYVGTKRKQ